MKRIGVVAGAAVLLAAGFLGGRWLGTPAPVAEPAAKAEPARRILYYRNPMGAPDISPVPKKDEMGMDYLPVYAPVTPGQRQILYYRNPMGAPDISPVPKKDEMGMDYLPVYADEATEATEASEPVVQISPARVQKLGVQTEKADLRSLGYQFTTVGRLAVDERLISVVSPRFEGWVEQLQVNGVGQRVQKGQILFVAYMHELYDAELAYRNAVRASMEPDLTPAVYKERELQVLNRLRQLERMGATQEEMSRLRAGGDPAYLQTYRSPVDGVVLERMAVQGARFMPGEALYRIADLSRMALMVDIPAAELRRVQPGTAVEARFEGWPDEVVRGHIDFIFPVLNGESRTAQARVMIANARRWPAGLGARVTVLHGEARRLAVPESAVIDSGERQVVLVAMGEGRYQARSVRTGVRAGGYVAIEKGLEAGEAVVVAANFLLDSESNLQAALRGLGAGGKP